MANELHGPESSAYAQLLAANDAASAAAAFDQFYERSAGTSRQQRVDAAKAIAGGAAGYGSADAAEHYTSSAGSTESVADSMGGLMGSVFTIAVKVVAAGAAAGLVITGALHTVSK
jgi:hypothetical protein